MTFDYSELRETKDIVNRFPNRHDLIVWIDVETSGVRKSQDSLLEIGALVSDTTGERFGSSYEALFSVANLAEVIENASENVRSMHERSGLWMDLWIRRTKLAAEIDVEMERWLLDSIASFETRGRTVNNVYFGGNSISLDRSFVESYLPKFHSIISYRSVDVTSLSIALQANTDMTRYEKRSRHRALGDACDSLDEYRHYVRFLSQMPRETV